MSQIAPAFRVRSQSGLSTHIRTPTGSESAKLKIRLISLLEAHEPVCSHTA